MRRTTPPQGFHASAMQIKRAWVAQNRRLFPADLAYRDASQQLQDELGYETARALILCQSNSFETDAEIPTKDDLLQLWSDLQGQLGLMDQAEYEGQKGQQVQYAQAHVALLLECLKRDQPADPDDDEPGCCPFGICRQTHEAARDGHGYPICP